jgi:D-alanyl-D-alanine carboxypeptidase (penicillin-binding protein 5/6)
MSTLGKILSILLLAFAPAQMARAAFETTAHAAWVYDVATGTVLLEKNANEPMPPASMSKLMTLYMLFEAIADGRVTMETTFPVSSRARSMGGSTMFLNETDRPTVRELISGIIVNSGNDACVVVAEGLAGSEEAFARLTTERARALGMTETALANSSGWPDPAHRMSMRDLGLLTLRIIEDFPEDYAFFDEREYDYEGRSPANRMNRNPLFRIFPGDPDDPESIRADGLKTGHTAEAGYGIVASAIQGERRVIVVVTGLASEQERADETARIISWAFRQFTRAQVARAGERVAEAAIWLGEADRVGLVVQRDGEALIPTAARDAITREVVRREPVPAPVMAGQVLGDLIVHIPGVEPMRIPVIAESDVAPAGFGKRLGVAAGILIERGRALAGF